MDGSIPGAAGRRRLTARFAGRVQGVGFRYTTLDLAATLAVAGYVSNLPDGDVELIAEGAEADLRELLARLERSHLGRFILRVEQQWSPATGAFDGFTIR